jgi:hypothetical protein
LSEVVEFSHEPAAAFRGSRDYIHSTDIYEEIIAGANVMGLVPSGQIGLQIRRKIVRRPIYLFSRRALPEEKDAAYANIGLSGSEWLVRVVDTAQPVEATKTYDEQRIFEASFIDEKAVFLRQNIGMRPIEVVTALSVKLHKTLFPPSPLQRWLLGRLQVSRPLSSRDAEYMAIEIERRIGRNITRARVIAEEGAIGSLTFMLG